MNPILTLNQWNAALIELSRCKTSKIGFKDHKYYLINNSFSKKCRVLTLSDIYTKTSEFLPQNEKEIHQLQALPNYLRSIRQHNELAYNSYLSKIARIIHFAVAYFISLIKISDIPLRRFNEAVTFHTNEQLRFDQIEKNLLKPIKDFTESVRFNIAKELINDISGLATFFLYWKDLNIEDNAKRYEIANLLEDKYPLQLQEKIALFNLNSEQKAALAKKVWVKNKWGFDVEFYNLEENFRFNLAKEIFEIDPEWFMTHFESFKCSNHEEYFIKNLLEKNLKLFSKHYRKFTLYEEVFPFTLEKKLFVLISNKLFELFKNNQEDLFDFSDFGDYDCYQIAKILINNNNINLVQVSSFFKKYIKEDWMVKKIVENLFLKDKVEFILKDVGTLFYDKNPFEYLEDEGPDYYFKEKTFEVTKFLAEKYALQFLNKIENFHLCNNNKYSKEENYALALILAEKEPIELQSKIDKFSLTPDQRFLIAKKIYEKVPQNFEIKKYNLEKKDRVLLEKQRDIDFFLKEKFSFNCSEEMRFHFARKVVKDYDPEIFVRNWKEFNLSPELKFIIIENLPFDALIPTWKSQFLDPIDLNDLTENQCFLIAQRIAQKYKMGAFIIIEFGEFFKKYIKNDAYIFKLLECIAKINTEQLLKSKIWEIFPIDKNKFFKLILDNEATLFLDPINKENICDDQYKLLIPSLAESLGRKVGLISEFEWILSFNDRDVAISLARIFQKIISSKKRKQIYQSFVQAGFIKPHCICTSILLVLIISSSKIPFDKWIKVISILKNNALKNALILNPLIMNLDDFAERKLDIVVYNCLLKLPKVNDTSATLKALNVRLSLLSSLKFLEEENNEGSDSEDENVGVDPEENRLVFKSEEIEEIDLYQMALEKVQRVLGLNVKLLEAYFKYNEEIAHRYNHAWFIYFSKLNQKEKRRLLPFFHGILEGKFYEERYSVENNPHLKKIFSGEDKIESLWRQKREYNLEDIDEMRCKEADDKLKTDPIFYLRQKICDDHHLENFHEYSYLLDYLHKRSEISLKFLSEEEQKARDDLKAEPRNENYLKIYRQLHLQKTLIQFFSKQPYELNFLKEAIECVKDLLGENAQFTNDLLELKELLFGKPSKINIKNWKIGITDSWKDMLLIGTEVMGSCQSIFREKKYSICLQSYIFDGKNLAVAIKDDKGAIFSRRIIRLLIDEKDNLVMVRERHYEKSGLTRQMLKALDRVCKDHAEGLGIPLLTSEQGGKKYPHKVVSLGSNVFNEYVDSGKIGITNGKFEISDLYYVS